MPDHLKSLIKKSYKWPRNLGNHNELEMQCIHFYQKSCKKNLEFYHSTEKENKNVIL